MKQIILASKSPRRKELLSRFGFPFDCVDANTDETFDSSLPVTEAIEQIAYQKAAAVARNYPEARIIAADSVVEKDGKIYGKPADLSDAARMLRELSGTSHRVITAVCIHDEGRYIKFHSVANVVFYELSDEEIASYIATGEPMDKAGAYGIQGYGCMLVEKIEGDFFTIVGLPVAMLWRKLQELDQKS